VEVKNFDWDSDGSILAISEVRQGQEMKTSSEDEWADDRIVVFPEEKERSYDFQFHKRKDFLVRNNNVVVQVRNQYGESMPFFSAPLGGIPIYKTKTAFNKIPPPKKKGN
jgi:hypothetical protein